MYVKICVFLDRKLEDELSEDNSSTIFMSYWSKAFECRLVTLTCHCHELVPAWGVCSVRPVASSGNFLTYCWFHLPKALSFVSDYKKSQYTRLQVLIAVVMKRWDEAQLTFWGIFKKIELYTYNLIFEGTIFPDLRQLTLSPDYLWSHSVEWGTRDCYRPLWQF